MIGDSRLSIQNIRKSSIEESARQKLVGCHGIVVVYGHYFVIRLDIKTFHHRDDLELRECAPPLTLLFASIIR